MRLLPLLALPLLPLAAWAGPDFDAAKELFELSKYPAARAAFEKIVATEPTNAAACHYLGLTWLRRGDTAAHEEAAKWLEKAATLEPKNARYVGICGGTYLELASRTTSISAANKGSDYMLKAIALDPDYLDAREGLFQFYRQAPWPLGSKTKARTQLDEIRKRDADRATALDAITKVEEKDYAGAFKLCDSILAKKPDDYTALYQYGRTASFAGQNLLRGAELLRKALSLPPPGPSSVQHTHVWFRLGRILEQLGQPAEARAAYESSLKLDSSNRSAADALAKLGK